MGKSDFSSSWCNWCPVEKSSWQNLDNTNDDRLWDIDTVNERVAINTEHNYTDERMMGQCDRHLVLTLLLPDVLYVDNLEGFPTKFWAGGL